MFRKMASRRWMMIAINNIENSVSRQYGNILEKLMNKELFLIGFFIILLSPPVSVMGHGGDPNLIHACIANSGVLKIIQPNEECQGSSAPIDWGIQGPPGPVDSEILGRISALESQIQFLQSKINDLEPPVISLTDVSLNEGNPTPGTYTFLNNDIKCDASVGISGNILSGCLGVATVTVVLNKPTTDIVTFDYTTINGTASAFNFYGSNGDYFTVSGNLSIPSGETTVTIDVPIIRDFKTEVTETFQLEISNVINADIDNPVTANVSTSAQITIDDDDLPTMTFFVDFNTHFEEQAAAIVFVNLSAMTDKEISVDYATVSDSALAGEDFEFTSGTLTFLPGEISKTIGINLINDTAPEGIHTFGLKFKNPINAQLSAPTVIPIEIWDDDVQISISDVTKLEGNSGTTPYTIFEFTVSLSEPVPGRVVYETGVDTFWPGSTITFSEDFGFNTPQTGTGTQEISPGNTTKLTTIGVIGDLEPENDEFFFLPIRNVLGASIAGDGVGMGTILNDD
jgi:hypothetical protein